MIKIGGPNSRSPSDYAQIRAECAGSTGVLPTRPPPRPRNPPAKGAVSGKRAIDVLADYARRVLDLAESSPHDPAARDALLWVIDMPGGATRGRMATNLRVPRRCSSAIMAMTPRPSASA